MQSSKALTLTMLIAQGLFSLTAASYITYGPERGRLGDKLILYTKTKWLAYKYNLTLLHTPFIHSDQFALHDLEQHLATFDKKKFSKTITVNNNAQVSANNKIPTLYKASWYYQSDNWGDKYEISTWSDLLNDQKFLAELRKMIKPRVPVEEFVLPERIITLAVHVRKGGGYDYPLYQENDEPTDETNKNGPRPHHYAKYDDGRKRKVFIDKIYPTRFPPDQYFIDQIKRVSEMFDDAPIYLHIFTDDTDPKRILEKIKREVGKPNITYTCREEENHYTSHILDDLFAMAKFDILIRPHSNFSQTAQLVGDHKIIIYPKHAVWKGKTLIIDDVGIINKMQTHES